MKAVLALDIGGTKINAAVVTATGKILCGHKEPVHLQDGPAGLVEQIKDICTIMAANVDDASKTMRLSKGAAHSAKKAKLPFAAVGIGCAGPLNSDTGELLDPTNFFTDGTSWGKAPLLKPLRKFAPKVKWSLDNDAAAAVLGEAWLGKGERENLLVMTLGTGVGVGVVTEGKIIRARPGLHPESSHIPLNYTDREAPCGCGLYGCIEAYLSGTSFAKRLAREWGLKELHGEEVVKLAAGGDKRAIEAFKHYGEWLAQAIAAYAVLYGPKQISLTGGFAVAADWFLPETQRLLPELLSRRREGIDLLPKVKVSRLGDQLGVLGAARLAWLAV